MKGNTFKTIGGILIVMVLLFLTVLANIKAQEAEMNRELAERTQQMAKEQMEACATENQRIAILLEELIAKVDSLSLQ